MAEAEGGALKTLWPIFRKFRILKVRTRAFFFFFRIPTSPA